MSVIWYIIIGIVSGFIAGKIMRGGGFGLLINLLVGIIGGLLEAGYSDCWVLLLVAFWVVLLLRL